MNRTRSSLSGGSSQRTKNGVEQPMRLIHRKVFFAIGAVVSAWLTPQCQCIAQQSSTGSTEKANEASPHELHFQLMQTVDRLEPYGPSENVEGVIEFAGSVTMQDLGKQWSRVFKQFHPNVEFRGSATGSEAALNALADNPKLFVGMSRPVDESDLQLLQKGKCKEPVAVTIGMEAIALFVHQSNPIRVVSPESFKVIFAVEKDGSSKPKKWGEVGVEGPLASETIATYERDSASGTQAFLTRVLLSGVASAKPFKVCSSNTDVCQSIANDPKGVGIADLNYDIPNVRKVPVLVDNHIVHPTEENVLTGRYPFVRPLLLVFDKSHATNDSKLREPIVRYVLSREGQLAVMKSGFFPVDPDFAMHQVSEIFGKQIR
jgi:phosphate transport system substrate-binding protein